MVARALKALLAVLFKVVLRARVEGLAHYPPPEQRVLIVANHSSWLDELLLAALLPDTPLFALTPAQGQRRWLKRLLRLLLPSIDFDPTQTLLLKTLSERLHNGVRVALFPEGRISATGNLMKVYAGAAVAAAQAGALILPVHIDGLQHSLFAGTAGPGRWRWPRVRLMLAAPRRLSVPPELSGPTRRQRLERLLDTLMVETALAATPLERTVLTALLDAGSRYGYGRAVLGDGRAAPLSYRQILLASHDWADRFLPHSAGQHYIGLLLPTGPTALTALLALHLHAQVPVLLDPSGGLQHTVSACLLAGVRTVYTTRAFVKTAQLDSLIGQISRRCRVVFLEDLLEEPNPGLWLLELARRLLPRYVYRRRAGPVSAQDVAVVVFATDSKGQPKGIALSHRNLLAGYAQWRVLLDLRPTDVVLNALPLHQTAGLVGTLVPLLQGVPVLLPALPSPAALAALAYQQAVTILSAGNSQFAALAQHAHPGDFFNLRYALAAHDRLDQTTRRLWQERLGVRVLEGYSTAEVTAPLALNTLRRQRAGSIGSLAPGLAVYLEPVAGLADGGRLCVRGATVMLGYLQARQPGQLSAPQTTRGAGWLNTGMVVTLDDEGFVTLQGPARRYARIGGVLVALAGLESLAGTLWPQARHAAIALPDPDHGEQLVLLTTRYDASRAELLKAAQDQGIGELYIPSQVIVVNELSMPGSGKLNHSAVRRLAETLLAAAPRTLH